ncbi:MAG: permease-like cell division protein FtsX [Actinomycetota bacterium]
MRLRLFLVEALRSIRSSMSISVAATVTVLNAIFILGIFIPVYLQVQSEVNRQREKLDIRVYIDDNATVAQVNGLRTIIASHPNTESFVYVSKQDALDQVSKQVDPEVLAELPANPLPASFEVKPKDPEKAGELIDAVTGNPALDTSGGDPITYGKETADKIIRAGNIIRYAGLGLLIVLMIASVLQIANTIRLSIFARRREVEVMKLVGATNWFIRWPFMIEGVICGVVGAVVSVLLLLAVKLAVVDTFFELSDSPFAGQDGATLSFPELALILVAAGAVVGALGGGITLRRFLRV